MLTAVQRRRTTIVVKRVYGREIVYRRLLILLDCRSNVSLLSRFQWNYFTLRFYPQKSTLALECSKFALVTNSHCPIHSYSHLVTFLVTKLSNGTLSARQCPVLKLHKSVKDEIELLETSKDFKWKFSKKNWKQMLSAKRHRQEESILTYHLLWKIIMKNFEWIQKFKFLNIWEKRLNGKLKKMSGLAGNSLASGKL